MNEPTTLTPPQFEPSEEQQLIQNSRSPFILVEANAGATKTTALAFRIRRALELQVPPERILVLTFTDAACEAMRGALADVGVPWPLVKRLRIRTFDQLSMEILRGIEGRRVPVLETAEEVAPTVRAAMEALGITGDSGFIERFLHTSTRLKGTLEWDLAVWNDEGFSEELAESLNVEPSHLRLFNAYENLRYARRDGVDFPAFRWRFDATYDLARLLADPEPKTNLNEMPTWPRMNRLIMVDEMHDTNRAMHTVLRKLLDTNSAYFCGVGDIDQVIHGQAGADYRYMSTGVELGDREIKRYKLTQTRRFGKGLAGPAGLLAKKPYASDAAHATGVAVRRYGDGDGDGDRCEDQVVEAIKDWKRSTGGHRSDVAVLLRHSWQSIDIENALLKAGYAYEAKGFKSYLIQPEVLLVRALWAMATDDYEQLNSPGTRLELVKAVVFFCQVKLGHDVDESETQEERLASAMATVGDDKESLAAFMKFQILENASPRWSRRLALAVNIAKESGQDDGWFERCLEALDVKTWVSQIFIERQRRSDAMKYFDGLKRAARLFKSARQFFESMGQQEQRLKAAAASGLKTALVKGHQARETLTLALIPQVKGLEFEHIVMPYLEEGVFPAALQSTSAREERNLFYVGMTRARSVLTLVAHGQRPSGLLEQAGMVLPARRVKLT